VWGSGSNGPLLFSNDAEPVYMLGVNRVTPLRCQDGSAVSVSISTDFFFGKAFPDIVFPMAVIHGSKISFKPTPNLDWVFRARWFLPDRAIL